MEIIIVCAASFFVYALASEVFAKIRITAAMWFTLCGFLISQLLLTPSTEIINYEEIKSVAEVTLIIVLASDASTISLLELRHIYSIPLRLLAFGLPLTIILGLLFGLAVFPAYPLVVVGLIAAILAPTDAALGSVVISNKAVPLKIRNSVSIESGLNDGIALPIVLLFIYFITLNNDRNWSLFVIEQIFLGAIAGVLVGFVGGYLMALAKRNKIIHSIEEAIAAMSLAILGYAAAEMLNGNGFIAAFFTGLLYGNTNPHNTRFMHKFTQTESSLFSSITFLLFGMVLLPEALTNISYIQIIYGALSLTIVRIIPVYLVLIGSKTTTFDRLFIGWFGPRGLASILYTLLLLGELPSQLATDVKDTITIVVLMSIIAHGVTAMPFSKLYKKAVAK